jgi:hypothetical protein
MPGLPISGRKAYTSSRQSSGDDFTPVVVEELKAGSMVKNR